MKERFIELIGKIDEIEGLFHRTPISPGLAVPSVEEIHDIQEFQLWLQEVTLEVQDIVDRTNDSFATDTLRAVIKPFNGWNDRKDFDNIKGKLQAMERNIEKYYMADTQDYDLPPKIFISHSSKDIDFVAKIVAVLDDMGLDQTQVFCSSLPGYGIPVGKDIFDYLREQFREFRLHVIIVHSPNYYKSPVSLNEMGAAWVLRSNCTSFLLPGFGFDGMRGVVNQNAIAIKLDNNEAELQDKLNQLYDMVVEEFGLRKKAAIIWEQKRDSFIRDVQALKVDVSVNENEDDNIEMNAQGLLIRKSDIAAGKNIVYCPTCYQNYRKLFPVTPGSMRRDMFCSNCKAHFTR